MSTWRYARGVCKDLSDYLAANLNTWIDTISSEEGYNPALVHPTIYRDAVHHSPVELLAIEVDCTTWRPEDLHNNYWYFDCVVHVAMRAPDAQVIVSQEMLRSYVSAINKCVMADPSLGNLDVEARIQGGDFAGASTQGELQLFASVKVTVKREEN